jgi:hypothetical protein
MASFWEQRFTALVRRALGLRESTALEPLGDLMPVLPVVDPAAAEWPLARNERRWAGWVTTPAVAGRNGLVMLVNPFGSDTLAVVERAWVVATTGTVYQTGLFCVGLANRAVSAARASMDRRSVGPGGASNLIPRCTLESADSLLASLSEWGPLMVGLTGTFAEMDCPVVLPAASSSAGTQTSGLILMHPVVNTAMSAGFVWRERTLGPASAEVSAGA